MSAAIQRRGVMRRFARHRLALVGGITVVLLCLSAFLAPAIAPRDPLLLDTSVRFLAPSGSASIGSTASTICLKCRASGSFCSG